MDKRLNHFQADIHYRKQLRYSLLYIVNYPVYRVIHLLNNWSWVDTGLSLLFLNNWGQENNGSVSSKHVHPLPGHLLGIGHLAVPGGWHLSENL